MNRSRWFSVTVVAPLTLALSSCATMAALIQASGETPELPVRENALNSLVGKRMPATGVPGAVFLLTQNGEEIWAKTYNLDPGTPRDAIIQPVAKDDIFAYRSVTKSFVVTVILILADQGKLSLDDPIEKYIHNVPSGHDITLRELAAMRAGIAEYSTLPIFTELLNESPGHNFTTPELVDPAYAVSPIFAPGEKFTYINTNTLILGQVIEGVTGISWHEAVAQYITEPLELRSVTYPQEAALPSPAALPYQVVGSHIEPLPIVNLSFFGAAGGLVGNAQDLARWADALGSGELLQPETQQERLDSLAPTTDGSPSPMYDRYGLGIGEIDDWLGHTGNGIGYELLAMHNPESNRSFVILINSTSEDGDIPAGLFRNMSRILSSDEYRDSLP